VDFGQCLVERRWPCLCLQVTAQASREIFAGVVISVNVPFAVFAEDRPAVLNRPEAASATELT